MYSFGPGKLLPEVVNLPNITTMGMDHFQQNGMQKKHTLLCINRHAHKVLNKDTTRVS